MTQCNIVADHSQLAGEQLVQIKNPDPQRVNELARALNISPTTARVLLNRRIDSIDIAQKFFNAQVSHVHDPWLFADMDKAVHRTLTAVGNGEKICVYGDYDVDGATSTSLLILFFRELGLNIDFYIPNRLTEGYSLNTQAIDILSLRGVKLIITVDNGIMAHKQVRHANTKNIDVIITDHHQVGETLPEALAIVNPQRKDCPYPFKGICGAGVAYKFLIALRQKLRENGFFKLRPEPNLKHYLDLLAIATVADMVPLRDENRFFVKEGLKHLAQTERPGLKALLKVANLKNTISSFDLGFRLGPRINACGRLEDASLGVHLLTSQDETEATKLATCLDQLNRERRSIEQNITEEAISKILTTFSPSTDAGIVVFEPTWHLGVVGIVASRIVERLHRPVFVLCQTENGEIKGSGRSVQGINLVAALHQCADLLLAFGGHEAAAGATLSAKNREKFVTRFNQAIAAQKPASEMQKTVSADAELSLNDISFELLSELERLEPFGMGNSKPLFVSRGLEIRQKRVVGDNHLKLTLCRQDKLIDAIAFGKATEFAKLTQAVDLLYGLEINKFNNRQSIQMVVKDFINLEGAT